MTTPARPTQTAEIREALEIALEKALSPYSTLSRRVRGGYASNLAVDAALRIMEPILDAALAERDEARNLTYQLKLAAAGGEDVPGSGQAVTVEDVNRWRVEASQREEVATAQAERTAGELAAAKAALSQIASHPRDYDDGVRSFGVGCAFSNVKDIARAALTEEPPHAAE